MAYDRSRRLRAASPDYGHVDNLLDIGTYRYSSEDRWRDKSLHASDRSSESSSDSDAPTYKSERHDSRGCFRHHRHRERHDTDVRVRHAMGGRERHDSDRARVHYAVRERLDSDRVRVCYVGRERLDSDRRLAGRSRRADSQRWEAFPTIDGTREFDLDDRDSVSTRPRRLTMSRRHRESDGLQYSAGSSSDDDYERRRRGSELRYRRRQGADDYNGENRHEQYDESESAKGDTQRVRPVEAPTSPMPELPIVRSEPLVKWQGLTHTGGPLLLTDNANIMSHLQKLLPIGAKDNPIARLLQFTSQARLCRLPADACWTKIPKSIVTSEALSSMHEAFGETRDHFILMRILPATHVCFLTGLTQELEGWYYVPH